MEYWSIGVFQWWSEMTPVLQRSLLHHCSLLPLRLLAANGRSGLFVFLILVFYEDVERSPLFGLQAVFAFFSPDRDDSLWIALGALCILVVNGRVENKLLIITEPLRVLGGEGAGLVRQLLDDFEIAGEDRVFLGLSIEVFHFVACDLRGMLARGLL